MMEWSQVISCSFTNGIRIFVCIWMITALLTPHKVEKSTVWLSLLCGTAAAALSVFPIPPIAIAALEMAAILCALRLQYKCELRTSAFLTFFFEIAAALWDFLFSAGLAILFRYSTPDGVISGGRIPVWLVRILMLGLMPFIAARRENAEKLLERFSSLSAVAGMFGVLILTEQTVVPLPDGQLATWVILSGVLLMAVLFYRVSRQYEMEQTIAQLETEKNALLERDYRTLSDTYAANAKLYHDFHNHMNVLHRYLSAGSTGAAIRYLEDLRSPVQTIAETAWTGDEAIDRLIHSKIALALSRSIRVNTNIEFPRHTNLKSVDLTAILGNLLDNAVEAAGSAEDDLRFIRLTIRRINDMLIIKAENGCGAAPLTADGELQTSKADKALHGWGLKSVRTAAGHYDGTVETEYRDHTFRAVVTLSFEAVSV